MGRATPSKVQKRIKRVVDDMLKERAPESVKYTKVSVREGEEAGYLVSIKIYLWKPLPYKVLMDICEKVIELGCKDPCVDAPHAHAVRIKCVYPTTG